MTTQTFQGGLPAGSLLLAQTEEQRQWSFLACCVLGWSGTVRAASCWKKKNLIKYLHLFEMSPSPSAAQWRSPQACPRQPHQHHLSRRTTLPAESLHQNSALFFFFLHVSICFLNVPLPLVAKVHTIPPEPVRHCSARLHFGLFQLHAPVGDTEMSCLFRLQILQSRQMCASVAPH